MFARYVGVCRASVKSLESLHVWCLDTIAGFHGEKLILYVREQRGIGNDYYRSRLV